MLIFSISFSDLIKIPYFMDTPERRVWGESRLKDRVTLEIILVFTLTCPKTFTRKLGCVIGFTHGYWQWCELRTQLSCWWRMPQYTWAINFHRWSLQRQNAHKIQVLKKSLQARKGNRTLGSWESTYSSLIKLIWTFSADVQMEPWYAAY
jgi:hypothetical protein